MLQTATTARTLFFALLLCLSAGLGAQTLPMQVLPKQVRTLLKDYALIPGGEFVKNLYTGYDSLQFQFPKRVSVDSFYMSRYEVTVGEYVRFFQETDDPRNKYDSAVWTKDFPYSYNEPMTRNYFWHPAFDDYPAVGITWEQAMRFCQWKSNQLNKLLENTAYTVAFTLPTDAEWQYAACGPKPEGGDKANGEQRLFPWGSFFLFPHSGKEGVRLHCNSGKATTPQGFTLFDYASDGGLYTLPVASFEPNAYGLYQMSGNVAEWTSDNFSVDYEKAEDAILQYLDEPETVKRYTPAFSAGAYGDYKIVKGGSWVDQPFYMQIGVLKIQHPEKASSMVGFRPVLRVFRK